MKTLLIVLLFSLIRLWAGQGQPYDALTYQQHFCVGMDVDWAKTDEGRRAIQKAFRAGIDVPKMFKVRGFDHVRIRIKEDVLQKEPDPVTNMRLIDELRRIVDASLAAGLTPVLAYQMNDYKQDPLNDTKLQKAIAWWRYVAETFKDRPYTLAYDLVIEPSKAIKKHNDRLNLFYQRTTAAIREIDPERIVIIAPNKISNPYMLKALLLPEPRKYLMAEWHFNAAGPKRDNPKKQWTTGTPYEKKLITDRIATAKAWTEQTGVPTWVGAWMPANYNDKKTRHRRTSDGAPDGGDYTLQEQIRFATFVSRSLQQADIPFCINSDSKYFDREHNRWYPSREKLLDAILKRY